MSREAIRARLGQRKTIVVDSPAWGCEVTLRELSAADHLGLPQRAEALSGKIGVPRDAAFLCLMVASSIVDDGQRVLDDDDLADMPAGDLKEVMRLAEFVLSLNGIKDDSLGNSNGSPTED